jgi:hypothetical protein
MQALGRVIIRVDGQIIDSMPGAKLTIGGVKRKPVLTGYNVHYAEEMEAATIECEVPLTSGMTLDVFRDMTSSVVIFEADTGQTWVIPDAFNEDNPQMTAKDGGNIKLKMTGSPSQQVT